MTKRNIWLMLLLTLITGGLYLLYWLVVTKQELNAEGATIPTAWLIIIPFANIYFLYKFAEGFSVVVLRDSRQAIAYFFLLFLVMPIGAMVYQSSINEHHRVF